MESVVHIAWIVYKLILYRTGANTHICYTQALLHILVLVIALCSAVVSTQLCVACFGRNVQIEKRQDDRQPSSSAGTLNAQTTTKRCDMCTLSSCVYTLVLNLVPTTASVS